MLYLISALLAANLIAICYWAARLWLIIVRASDLNLAGQERTIAAIYELSGKLDDVERIARRMML